MTPGARYAAVIKLYDMVMEANRPADQVLHLYFKQRKFIGSKDRRFIAETLFTVLRHFARLEWWAARYDVSTKGRAITLLWLALGTNCDLNDVRSLFDGAGYSPNPMSPHEMDVVAHALKQDMMPSDMPEDVAMECPEWAYQSLKKCYGDNFRDEMLAMQEEAPLDMRVNTLKAKREPVLKRLQKDGFEIAATPFSPLGLRVQGRPPFSMHPLYKDGWMEVQDEGSQMLALLCGVQSGEWVVDFCAGAGGKTLALAAQMQNKGRIWACDIEQNRLENSRKRLRRAGIHCVETQLLDDEEDDWVRKHKDKADCVLIDAPCSGLGTWRRNPFSRWQNLGPSVKALIAVQERILQSASRLVKPGGRLIYATCSMLPEENQEQVDKFLQANPKFKAVPLEDNWQRNGMELPEGLDLSVPSLQLTPRRHDTDGFFVSAMQRL